MRLYSRRWEALQTGAVLVDAPGVHDDNSARDSVVKAKLKHADAIWIVSNIVRAVNDKTAKDLLGAQFRRSPRRRLRAPQTLCSPRTHAARDPCTNKPCAQPGMRPAQPGVAQSDSGPIACDVPF